MVGSDAEGETDEQYDPTSWHERADTEGEPEEQPPDDGDDQPNTPD
jgi:hypothetical protein